MLAVELAEPRSVPSLSESTVWTEAAAAFLASKSSPHTRRAYRIALRDFFDLAGKTPDRVTVADVSAWRAVMESRKASPKTVSVRLTALSAFFEWLTLPRDAMGTVGLCRSNPVRGNRPKCPPYANARKMRLADFQRLLETTEGDSLADKRDRALLLAYAVTGRRRAELVRLRGRDIEPQPDGGCLYRYTGKHGKAGLRELPPPVLESLRDYLEADGRALESLSEDEPLFPSRFGRKAGEPITADAILRMLKSRARRAGIDPRRIQTHGLRHLCAETRRDAGETVESVSAHLDHSSIATTASYLRQVCGVRDDTWQRAHAILLGREPEAVISR